ncbi:hypothetical protein H0194_09545 [Corynebacterium incognita]|uniref:Uncharacterized protein n=1 Tax=Corynebacterium incognita TaxID=2754725 RepID=A0A7G7CNW2_9CORY|nr:hypothetical protein [Corynebacterium incognita]QNE89278.1 hypothetical protein H0194_09545 [Corynebacterium incognita]
MQLRGYADRVDFISRSGAAGSVCFGDTRRQVEDFFGRAHRVDGDSVLYFHDALEVRVPEDGGVESITMRTDVMKEKVSLHWGKDPITGASVEQLDAFRAAGLDIVTTTEAAETTENGERQVVKAVTFSAVTA